MQSVGGYFPKVRYNIKYCSIENPTSPSSEQGSKEAVINLLYPEFTCWYYDQSEQYQTQVRVGWYLSSPIYQVYLSLEYWFNANNQIEWRIVFEDEQYSNLEFDVYFRNHSLADDNGFVDIMGGGVETYHNEFPPLIEGTNRIEVEIIFLEHNYIPCYQQNYEIEYSSQTGGNDNNQGGGNENQCGNSGGDNKGSELGCFGNVNSPVGMIGLLVLVGAFIVVKAFKNKKD